MKAARLAAIAVCFALACSLTLQADSSSRTIYKQALKSTAWVLVRNGNSTSSGTAWLVDRERKLLVTNHHVVGDAADVLVLFPIYQEGRLISERKAYRDERGIRGKVVDTDVPTDLAVIQLIDPLPEGTAELKLATEGSQPGEDVFSIGNPGVSDALWCYTDGTVRSAAHRKEWQHLDMQARRVIRRNCLVMQTQSPVNPGDSGGPVLNEKGEVVAVVSSSTVRGPDGKDTVQLMTLNIDVSEVRKFVDQTRRLLEPKTSADYTLRGNRQIERRLYDDAINALTQAIKLDPKNALAYQRRGWAFSCKGDHDTAIADCSKAISIDPEDAVSYENRGWAYDKKKEYDKALEDYSRAVQIDPNFSRAYQSRGVLYEIQKKDFARALDNYGWALKADPGNAVVLAWRADLYYNQRNYNAALADAERALEIDPFQRLAWNVRGWVLRERKQLDQALDNFNLAMRFDPDNLGFCLNRGIVYARMGEPTNDVKLLVAAESDYNRCLERDRNYAPAWFYRGQLYERAGMMNESQRDYQAAIEKDKSYAERLKNLNTCYLRFRNNATEPVRVYVQYEYRTQNGEWVWWPPQDNIRDKFWDFAQNEQAIPLDGDWRLKARRVRVWITGRNTNKQYANGQLVELCPENGYLAGDTMLRTYIIR